MKYFIKVIVIAMLVMGLTCSCNSFGEPIKITPLANEKVASKQEATMVNGDVYIYANGQLFDLLNMEWTYPAETPLVDRAFISPGEWISMAKNNPKSYILTVTVEGYTEQSNTGPMDSTDMRNYLLATNCRIDKIHYMGDEIFLQEGEVYNFKHGGYWVLNKNDTYMYSRVQDFSMLRYGRTYIVFGGVGTEGALGIWKEAQFTEICDEDDYKEFQAKILELEGRIYPARCKEFLELFAKP